MKASRLLSILMLLQARGRMTAPALAQALEVSPRTILRDLDQLSAAGVPLWGEPGRSGGFQLRKGWSTTLTGMTEDESQALLLAGLPGPATDLGLGAAAASARLKLVASLPAEWREQADLVGTRLYIDPVDWYRSREAPEHLRAVADAVWNARCVTVCYQSWRSVTERVLEPLGLVLKAGTWYMAARVAGQDAVRTYRLSGITALCATTTTFRRPKAFDLGQYWQTSAARFETELKPLQARVAVSPRALGWLRNERRLYSCEPAVVGRLTRAGWTTVLMPIESIEQGARNLLSYGAEVEVIEPPALRQQLIDELHAVRERYDGAA